uniref:Transmembrane protein 150B n=1 Tax=Varanus komodoensis TaxID=61221 RepID=A0A8D2LKG1_VARKO
MKFPNLTIPSTCGAYPPQSCLFGQVLNLGAFLGKFGLSFSIFQMLFTRPTVVIHLFFAFSRGLVDGFVRVTCLKYPPFGFCSLIIFLSGVVICYLRYQQVRDYGCHSHLNLAGLILGIFFAIGASLVGNFQQYNQLETHLVGAFLAFVIGIVYFWVQAFLTNRVNPRHGGPWMAPLRFSLSFCSAAFFIAIVLFTLGLTSEAAYCEWALAMNLFVLFGLFAVDFWHVGNCVLGPIHRDGSPNPPF